jgi:hypothetical protein
MGAVILLQIGLTARLYSEAPAAADAEQIKN